MTPHEHLETQQALFKQFAEILDFVLKFDDLKVNMYIYFLSILYFYPLPNEVEAGVIMVMVSPRTSVPVWQRVAVDSPQNHLPPTNSPHIYANSSQPTCLTFILSRPTFMLTRPNQLAPHYTNSPHIYTNLPYPNPTISMKFNIIIHVYEINVSEI